METLFQSVAEHQAKERAERLAEYFRFLAGVDIAKPSPEDAATLSGYLTALDKSAAAAQADWREIQAAKIRLKHIADTEGADERVAPAYAALENALAERQETWKRINEKAEAAGAVHRQAEADRDLRFNALKYLRELSATNPALHAAVNPPVDSAASPAQRKRK